MQIPKSLYDYYVGLPRPPTPNYSVYVTHPWDDTVVEHLISTIEEVGQEEGFSDFETAEFAATFVQSLPYTADSVTTPYDEYPRYPVETLVDYGGDCEDTAILLASLIRSMGYGTILIVFPGNHCAVGVLGGGSIYGTYFECDGRNYFYIETTDAGWGIGDIPEEYEGVIAKLYKMTPTPILTHTWTAKCEGTIVHLEVMVENLGSATAQDVYVLAGFDAGADMLWNSKKSQPFNVLVDQSMTVTLALQLPLNKHTRLVIQIADNGYAVDQSYSAWFDT